MTFAPALGDAEPRDIGSGHTITLRYRDLPHRRRVNGEWVTEHISSHLVGLHEDHGCGIAGWIPFANAEPPFGRGLEPLEDGSARHAWTVEDWEPETLTLSPSLLCSHCGDHGFIRRGRWEPC